MPLDIATAGVSALARGVPKLVRGTYLGWGVPTLARGVPTLAGRYPPWDTPWCEQTENITFPHPSDAVGNNPQTSKKMFAFSVAFSRCERAL